MAERTCSEVGCEGRHEARGRCKRHYQQWKREAASLPSCSESGCDKRAIARGLCGTHYERLRIHGSPADPRPSFEARFWAKVEKGDGTGCWLWQGAISSEGYGTFHVSKGKRGRRGAHRIAYELLVGPIPEGLGLDHVRANGCTSRACVKAIADAHGPTHLEPVTQQENCRRSRLVVE